MAMKKWIVTAGVRGSTWIGETEAETGQEAVQWGRDRGGVSLCHQCSDQCEDPQIYSVSACAAGSDECVEENEDDDLGVSSHDLANTKELLFMMVVAHGRLNDGTPELCKRFDAAIGTETPPALLREHDAWAQSAAVVDDLYRELKHIVRLLEPEEKSGNLQVPGLATLNGARAALKRAKATSPLLRARDEARDHRPHGDQKPAQR